MSYTTVFIITAIIGVIILFRLFVLCDNVSSIKREIGGADAGMEDKFNIYLITNQKDKAKEMLLMMIISEGEWESVFHKERLALRDSARSTLIGKYKTKLDAVGLELDFSA